MLSDGTETALDGTGARVERWSSDAASENASADGDLDGANERTRTADLLITKAPSAVLLRFAACR